MSMQSRAEDRGCLTTTRMVTSLDDIQTLRFWKAVAAEFLGTLLLVFVGCGSCIPVDGPQSVVLISLCFGLSVATIIWNISHVSGGHINPAVTIAMLATRKISLVRATFYFIFQLTGAIVGAALLYALIPNELRDRGLGTTTIHSLLYPGRALGVEILATFILVFTVFASVDSKRKDLNGSTPLAIGLSVTMCHLFALPLTGCSMNTARSFGPAVVIGIWTYHWVYWVGPIVGGLLAGIIYEQVFATNASMAKAKACMLSAAYDDDKYEAHKVRIRIIEEDDELETIKLKDAEDGITNGDKIDHEAIPTQE